MIGLERNRLSRLAMAAGLFGLERNRLGCLAMAAGL